jgi:glycosyltransferase involved in cell wall biosynthesis
MKIPFIYTERLSAFMTGKIPPFHIPIIKSSIVHASRITVVSRGLQMEVARFTKNQIQIIPNFYDRSIFYPNFNIKKNKVFTFVSVGEPAHIKGFDILLKAFAILKHKLIQTTFQLVLIDRIPEEKDLRRLAQILDIDNQITWTGLISQDAIATILCQSHVFVSSSRVETFGKSIIEALACGLPVIATKTSGAESIMTSPELGVVVPINDEIALSEAMEKMHHSVNAYDPNSISLEAKNRFSQSVVIPQWIKLYQSVCG